MAKKNISKKPSIYSKLKNRFEFINSLRSKNASIFSEDQTLRYDINEIQKVMQELQEAYNQYLIVFNMLENIQTQVEDSSILSSLAAVMSNEISGSNLAAKLLNDQTNLTNALSMYDKYYNKFFEAYNKSIDVLEKVGSSLRGEKNLFHFGMIDQNNFLKEFSLDDASMSEFRRDQKIFKLERSKDGQIKMLSKANLERNTVLESLQTAVGGRYTSSRYGVGELLFNQTTQNSWFEYATSGLFSRRKDGSFGAALKMGRRYEAFEEGMTSVLGTQQHLMKIQEKGYTLDTLPWTAGQDNTKFDWISNTQYAIQNKFFNFNKDGNTEQRRIGISSITTIFDTLDLLSKPDMVQERYMFYTEQTLFNMSEEQLFTELYGWQGQGNYSNPFLSNYEQAVDNFGESMVSDFTDLGLEAYWG